MNAPLRHLVPLLAVAALAVLLPCANAAAETATNTPLPSSNYVVRAACQPPSHLHASCLSEQLIPVTAQARSYSHPIGIVRPAAAPQPALSPAAGDFGLRPQDIHSAYSLPNTVAGEPLLAVIDAYNNPTAAEDLETYSAEFKLPQCTAESGCFKQVGENGLPGTANLPFPKTSKELKEAELGSEEEQEEAEAAIGWGIEISLDVESAHATCQSCRILLVEAESTSYFDLEEAERTAETLGAKVISNSWGGPEAGVTVKGESEGPFNKPGVVITASSGDNGYLGWDASFPSERGFTSYPAASPHVVSVGGTRLTLGVGGTWASETVWNGSGASGGGCSIQFTAPAWQQAVREWSGVGCTSKRSVTDVAADADPHSGMAITATSPACEVEFPKGSKTIYHWCTYGGTSLAAPIIAGVFGLAGGSGGVTYPALTLYETRRHAPGMLHDVTVGSNGRCALGFNEKTGLSNCTAAEEASASCSGHRTCLTSKGYDGPTGVGTPNGIRGFQPGAEEPGAEEEPEEHREEVVIGPSSPAAAPAAVAAPAGPPAAPVPALQLRRLALTTLTLIALNRHRPSIAKIGFSFELTRAANVRVSLARRVRVHHRSRWLAVGSPATMTALAGRNAKRLSGRTRLTPGLYRLTVTPAGAKPQSLLLHIG